MKKLNRKGFTLIELLAVIVVLAIVLVVTIPSVISSMNSAKTSQLKNAVDTATKWFTEQYEIEIMGEVAGTPDSAYTSFFTAASKKMAKTSSTDPVEITKDTTNASGQTVSGNNDILVSAGISNPKGLTGKVYLNGNSVCVELTADSTSQFYNASATGNENTVKGNGC